MFWPTDFVPTSRVAWLAVALLLAALCASHAATWAWGRAAGRQAADAACAEQGRKAAMLQAGKRAAQQQRSQAIATRAETAREDLTATFHRLDEEASHDRASDVDACVLPAERLRRWVAANAGRDDAAPGEPDAVAGAVAAAGLGGDARPGSEPSLGGAAVPPVGDPLLRAAATPAGAP